MCAYKPREIIISKLKLTIRLETCMCIHAGAFELLVLCGFFKCEKEFKTHLKISLEI
jgi:hypothetical protein